MSQFVNSSPALSISGEPLILKDKNRPKLRTRKIFDSTYFHDERYRHEIANHYRDYKQQQQQQQQQEQSAQRPRIKRKRRSRKPAVNLGRGRTGTNEGRHKLVVAVHNYPRYTTERVHPTTPAIARGADFGREVESCVGKETYNDTLRRIRAANSTKEFADLVRRQLDLVKSLKQREIQKKKEQEQQQEEQKGGENTATINNAVNALRLHKSKQVQQQQQQQQQRQQQYQQRQCLLLEKILQLNKKLQEKEEQPIFTTAQPTTQLTVKSSCKYNISNNNKNTAKCKLGECDWYDKCKVVKSAFKFGKYKHYNKYNFSKQQLSSNEEVDTYYLKLAADYYEQGLLANIAYLKDLGERTLAIKTKRQKQQQQQAVKSFAKSYNNIITTTANADNSQKQRVQQLSCTVNSESDSANHHYCDSSHYYDDNGNDNDYNEQLHFENITTSNAGQSTSIYLNDLNLKKINEDTLIKVNIKPSDLYKGTNIRKQKHLSGRNAVNTAVEAFNCSSRTSAENLANRRTRLMIMNDLFNANFQQHQQQQQQQHHQFQPSLNYHTKLRSNNNNITTNTQQQQHLYELIDNLQKLELNGKHHITSEYENIIAGYTPLPKITLTDCGEISQEIDLNATLGETQIVDYINEYNSSEQNVDIDFELTAGSYNYNQYNKLQRQQQQQQQQSRNLSAFELKETKFDFGTNRNLSLPSELLNYHSEARPP